MKITIALRDSDARRTEYYLRRRYSSKATLGKLAKVAILDVAAEEAKRAGFEDHTLDDAAYDAARDKGTRAETWPGVL